MDVFSVFNLKGGTGKSTVTMLLAGAMASDGKKVLILDCDEQQSIKMLFETEKEPDVIPLFDVQKVHVQSIRDALQSASTKYDMVFIDLPRFTSASDGIAFEVLAYCDLVLVPVMPSQMDVLSTLDLLPILSEVKAVKKKAKFGFKYFGFLNKVKNRSENSLARETLEQYGLTMFDATLQDVKIFLYPSAFTSILNSPDGKKRFGDFFNEFKSNI